jgi:hypothetical protein
MDVMNSYFSNKFPHLFGPKTSFARYGGFQCREGWTVLIDSLVSDLAEMEGGLEKITVQQVKEKFGGLRFYAKGLTPEQSEIVIAAESKSMITCEVCGQEGRRGNYGGLASTLCDSHANQKTQ